MAFLIAQTEADTTVQQRAVDVLYAICETSSVTDIVQNLLEFLETADYSLREELVRLKL
jgi:AP-2 complex subunit alpha